MKDIPRMEHLSQLQKLCDQDAFLELHSNSKRPVSNDWPNQGQPAASVLSSGRNIGLILGNTSGILDVDKDFGHLTDIVSTWFELTGYKGDTPFF